MFGIFIISYYIIVNILWNALHTFGWYPASKRSQKPENKMLNYLYKSCISGQGHFYRQRAYNRLMKMLQADSRPVSRLSRDILIWTYGRTEVMLSGLWE